MGFTPGVGPKTQQQLQAGPAPSSFTLGGGPHAKGVTAASGGIPNPGKSGGGGILGGLTSAGHWIASKADLAAHDIKTTPGGLVDLSKQAVNPGSGGSWSDVGRQWEDLLTGHPVRMWQDAAKTQAGQRDEALIGGIAKSSAQSVQHPFRDPFQTLTTVAPLLHGAGSAALRTGAAVDAVRAGEGAAAAAKAVVSRPAIQPRLIRSGEAQVPLQPSQNPAVRIAQHAHDTIVQHALDTNPTGRVAAYGQRRIGGALDEAGRAQQRMREAPAVALQQAAKKLTAKGQPGVNRVHQAALELTSTNTPPEKAAAFHLDQAAKGVEPARNRTVAKLYDTVARKGLLTTNEHGDVIVNVAAHPKLAQADLALAKVQGRGDQILARYNIRSPEELQAAVNNPGRYRAGATYEPPTPGKLGKPSQALISAQARVARLQTLFDKSQVRDATAKGIGARMQGDLLPAHLGGRGLSPITERLGGALSVAKEDLARLEQQAANRVRPTGVIGGETARPGRGHVSYASSEKTGPTSPAAASSGTVVGEAKPPIGTHANTGYNIQHGIVPADITGMAARHYRQIIRFVNTTERRNAAIATGSDLRRSRRDVLVKVPGDEHAQLTQELQQAVGKAKPTADELNGLHAALEAYRQQLVPGVADRFAGDAQYPIGASAADAAAARGLEAPEGYKWVDRGALGELAKPAFGPRGKIARSLDNVNSAVTAATVYFKVGHLGTRALTNATTNIIQGSATPTGIAKTLDLWHGLSPEDRARAFAASGQHSMLALPHDAGTGRISRPIGAVAGAGARWWARRIDAPFRFNSIAYEARKAGYDTPAKFRDLLNKLESPHDHNMSAAERSRVMGVANRANREAIAYDRLSDFEKRYITRAFWFYPWTAGATRFAANTLREHPYKSAVLGAAGVEGRQAQQQELGDLPTHEWGLFQLKRGPQPLVADFSTFSPFATAADVLNAVARPKEFSGFLNPAYAAGNSLINGLTAYKTPSTSPIADALATAVSPMPETQILTGYLNRNKPQGRKMFPASPDWSGTKSPILRALIGPGMPRRLNPAAAHSAAARQRAGR